MSSIWKLARATFSAPARPHEKLVAALLFGIATAIPLVSGHVAAVASGGRIGWTSAETALSLGFYSLGLGIVMSTIWPGLSFLLESRETGWLDHTLLFPQPTHLLVAILRPYKEAGWLLLYGLVLVLAGLVDGGSIHPFSLILGAVFFIAGVIGVSASIIIIWTASASRCELRPLMDSIGVLLSAARVPGAAYPSLLRAALFMVLPLGMLTSIPAGYFAGSPPSAEVIIKATAFLATLCIAALACWKSFIKKYQTGI